MARKDSFAGQRYACDRPGCDKHYSRPDHLLRHKLNHDREKVLACDQCDRTFVRQDLLTRHLERHALRGKTLGRWSGRQSEGDSSTAGPSNGKRQRRKSRTSAKDGQADDDDDEDDDLDEDDLQDESVLLGMGGTGRGPAQSFNMGDQSHLHPSIRQPMISSMAQAPHASSFDRFDPATAFGYGTANPASAAQQFGYHTDGAGFASAQHGIAPPMPYDVSFDTQAASMPSAFSFQQTSNTSDSRSTTVPWETQRTGMPAEATQTRGWAGQAEMHGHAILASSPISGFHSTNAHKAIVPLEPLATPEPSTETMALLHSSVPGSSHFPFSAPVANDYVADYDWLFDGTNPLMPEPQAIASGSTEVDATNNMAAPTEEANSASAVDRSNERQVQPPIEVDSRQRDRAASHASLEAQAAEPTDALRDLAFFAILQTDIPDEPAFDVDQATTSRLLHFLSSLPELRHSPLFTPAALRCYLHLFFTRLNTIYPLIHQPTFSAKGADAMLLSAMIVCGAHFADEAAHFLAERVGRKLWGAFISFEDFRPARATLAMLQAMLITETFGKMMGTRPQHETAHLFHNFIVTLARRNAVFIQAKVKLPNGPEEHRWRAWAREEEKKRISLYSFLLDAQHATIFRHIPALSAFQIHLQLPCDDDEWNAKGADEWATVKRGKKVEDPNFIAALKAALLPSGEAEQEGVAGPTQSDGFKQFVLLHGLMSVAYDLQWKQQALLTAPDTSENIANWKDRLLAGYNASKNRLDKKTEGSLIDKASYSLIEWAQIVLHADSVDIQIYAGLPTIMGRFIDHHTFSIARKSCRDWAKTADARTALRLAARFLRATLLPSDALGESLANGMSSVNGVDFLLHHQWVQYLSSLVIWAYEQALSPVKQQATSRARSQDRDSVISAPTADAHDGPLQQNATLHAQSALAKHVNADKEPPVADRIDKIRREAKIYLDAITGEPSSEYVDFEAPHHYSTAVLELVERECRGSRWELGREASGVLRKLIRERQAQENNSQSSMPHLSPAVTMRQTNSTPAPDALARSSPHLAARTTSIM